MTAKHTKQNKLLDLQQSRARTELSPRWQQMAGSVERSLSETGCMLGFQVC